jgi:hypothetical protein
VKIAIERTDPSVKVGWRARNILGAIPGIVVGWFALGPAIVVVAVVVFVVVCGLLLTGPWINLHLYGTERVATASLHACAARGKRSGTLDVERGHLRWTPWKRYSPTEVAIDLGGADIERAVLFARRGIPSSCRLELHLGDAAVQDLTVFSKVDSVGDAVRSAFS